MNRCALVLGTQEEAEKVKQLWTEYDVVLRSFPEELPMSMRMLGLCSAIFVCDGWESVPCYVALVSAAVYLKIEIIDLTREKNLKDLVVRTYISRTDGRIIRDLAMAAIGS